MACRASLGQSIFSTVPVINTGLTAKDRLAAFCHYHRGLNGCNMANECNMQMQHLKVSCSTRLRLIGNLQFAFRVTISLIVLLILRTSLKIFSILSSIPFLLIGSKSSSSESMKTFRFNLEGGVLSPGGFSGKLHTSFYVDISRILILHGK